MAKEVKKATTKANKEEKTMSKSKKTEVKVENKVEEVKQEKVDKKENKEKKVKAVGVRQMTNSELAALFTDNGCVAESNAKDSSKVVYNQFGTKSRILQQTKGYQLLLTNGHTKKKDEVLNVEYNDVERFKEWYRGLNDAQKAVVSGFETIDATKLSDSEFPREKTVKINSYELLIEYIKFMAQFAENKRVVA